MKNQKQNNSSNNQKQDKDYYSLKERWADLPSFKVVSSENQKSSQSKKSRK